jgi:hypothetical protein
MWQTTHFDGDDGSNRPSTATGVEVKKSKDVNLSGTNEEWIIIEEIESEIIISHGNN